MSARALKLNVALQSLLTDCVIVGHANKADVVFTSPQWFAMCAHMGNENPSNFFLMPYQDKSGEAKFAKAYNAKVDDRIQWAWDTITGKAKSPASIGFYPTNAQRQSRWAAMDFDMHDDDQMRARDLAHKAFALLIREPHLYVALTTSAGDPVHSGWHLFIFTEQFYPCEEWTRLLKQVADQIGAPVKSGVCEIFPDDCKGIGRGIRAPGTLNPKNGEFGLILHETFSKLLPAVRTPKESNAFLGTRCPTREKFLRTPSREFAEASPITAPSTRHEQLLKLIGSSFLQASREVARQNSELQYNEANLGPVATLPEHLAEFDEAWTGMERKWLRKLSPSEREKFDALTTDNEREAFKILRNWSQTDSPHFYAHCKTLGNRLGIELSGAAKIRLRFCSLGIRRNRTTHLLRLVGRASAVLASDIARERQGTHQTGQSFSGRIEDRLARGGMVTIALLAIGI